jgi:hypothetical protein
MLLNSGMWKILALRFDSFHPSEQRFATYQLSPAKPNERQGRNVFHLPGEEVLNVRFGAFQNGRDLRNGQDLCVIRGQSC